ncbi:hypothetical protein [Candidatus Williamhamiltonella defendens]|uniref:Uncharacterized protein n=1 Tax=Candidatus Hamiltonella defensa (Bemisia tabaci) TaxID=672795 RepID=A0A249DW94_9ENTR|nr:hypothetical protein [Candidatus Hamiltonella defensa]ASX25649.1 hypothetical protein BA171_00195 [Candidatus Hamiltonella defensa (Bemisia tabaci)]
MASKKEYKSAGIQVNITAPKSVCITNNIYNSLGLGLVWLNKKIKEQVPKENFLKLLTRNFFINNDSFDVMSDNDKEKTNNILKNTRNSFLSMNPASYFLSSTQLNHGHRSR